MSSENNNMNNKMPGNPNEPHKTDHKSDKQGWLPPIVGGLIGASLVGVFSLAMGQDNATNPDQAQIESMVQEQVQKQNEDKQAENTQTASLDVSTDVSETVSKVQGAVVSVANLADTNSTIDLFGLVQPDRQESNNDEANYETASEGSGVVYKIDGDSAYVVTNNHVIDGSDALEVITSEGKQVKAELVGADVWTDLAVLRIPAEEVDTVAEFGDSDTLTVGEPAIAIGSPLGSDFASTVTQGIISGLDRTVPVDLDGDNMYDWQVNAIQTDAAINPGNSGGALLNSAGQVIGINSMKISADQVEGMGFAIPANDVQSIITQLERDGRVIRPSLGVVMATLNQVPMQQQEEILNVPDGLESGVVVLDIEANSPAANAGLKVNDIITKFNGQEVADAISLRKALYSADANQEVEVEFYRDGKQQTVKVQLEPQEEQVF